MENRKALNLAGIDPTGMALIYKPTRDKYERHDTKLVGNEQTGIIHFQFILRRVTLIHALAGIVERQFQQFKKRQKQLKQQLEK